MSRLVEWIVRRFASPEQRKAYYRRQAARTIAEMDRYRRRPR